MKLGAKKNRRLPWLQAAICSLALFSYSANAGISQIKCELKPDDLGPDYRGPGKNHCQANTEERECLNILEFIDRYSPQLRKLKEKTCTEVNEKGSRLAALDGTDTFYNASISLYEGVLRRYDSLDSALREVYVEMKRGVEPVLADPPATPPETPPNRADRLRVQTEIKDPVKLAKNNFGPAKTPSDITGDIHKRNFAMKNGVNFMKDLLREIKETTEAKESLGKHIDELKLRRDQAMKPPSSGPSPTTGPAASAPGSGLNPTALMGLATAAAGLAGMMNKQQADSGMPAATSPTPDSLKQPGQEKPAIAVSKLDNGKSTAPGKADILPKATDTNTSVASPSIPSGHAFKDDSDISNSTPSTTPRAAAASSKAPGGGSSGGAGGDSGGLPVTRDPSAVLPEHKEEEAMQGIGGGGLSGGPGGGGSSGGAPVDPAVEAAEDSMKDLLTEMKETADGETGGNSGETQADGSIMEMDAEDLFPRVRAAHVRCLKQGRVHNGLGEKISPDQE